VFGVVLSALSAAILLRYGIQILYPATVLLAGVILTAAAAWRLMVE
jgi:hypothetical protein